MPLSVSEETKTRTIFGLLAGALVLIVLFSGIPQVLLGVCLLASALGWHEICLITNLKKQKVFYIVGYPVVLALLLLQYRWEIPAVAATIIVLLGFILLFLESRSLNKREVKDMARTLLAFTGGILYCFFLFGFISPIARSEAGHCWVLFGILLISFGDIAAYAVGRRRGRHKLWPEVSPGKSVQGAVAGVFGAMIAALIIWTIFEHFYPHLHVKLLPLLVIALVGSPLAQLGDLLESLIKRISGAKDSGALIPGHGGILDRTDGFLFVFPLLYYIF